MGVVDRVSDCVGDEVIDDVFVTVFVGVIDNELYSDGVIVRDGDRDGVCVRVNVLD